ncbi:MAG TPA: hypothetical protein VMU40_07660 [Steroidobacteraceae bacterium]|nr:hypothetical protein [Steroidobacteraceae bacterium]
MDADYSKAALMRFLDLLVPQGLMKPNTVAGLRAACGRILEDVADGDDVRKIDVGTAIRKYHNRHPGELKGTVLAEYERRLKRALTDFVQYTDNPKSYKGRGRGPGASGEGKAARKAKVTATDTNIIPGTGALAIKGDPPFVAAVAGLTLSYPLRADFLAQVVVPRDMTSAEARRLASFIMTLAADYAPTEFRM